jgi:hypothetical protein
VGEPAADVGMFLGRIDLQCSEQLWQFEHV